MYRGKQAARVIYQPSGRAAEYAAWAANLYRGCGHRCAYCYVRSLGYLETPTEPRPRLNILERIARDARSLARQGVRGRVLLCFTTDPYQPIESKHKITRQTIRILHRSGLGVQVLTKGGTRALRDLKLFDERDAFASTLTLLDTVRSREWEPGAATPAERILTLRRFHEAGITTWVSLEPVIDPAIALEIIRQTHDFVDLFKVGKLNHERLLTSSLASEVEGIDWRAFAIEVTMLLGQLGKRYYIKSDLRSYLPQSLITSANSTPPHLWAEQQPRALPVQGQLL